MGEQNQSSGQTQNAPAKKPWYKKWWIITIGVFIILGVIGSSYGDDKNNNRTQEAQQSQGVVIEPADKKEESVKPKEAVPQVTVTSAVLAKDYSENEVAADDKYKGKLIEISGKVTGVDNGITDNEFIVKLSDGEYDFSGPWCYMKPSEKEEVIAIKKGQQVTLIGEGNSATIGSPMLKDCVIK